MKMMPPVQALNETIKHGDILPVYQSELKHNLTQFWFSLRQDLFACSSDRFTIISGSKTDNNIYQYLYWELGNLSTLHINADHECSGVVR